jgi:hypothetical protein
MANLLKIVSVAYTSPQKSGEECLKRNYLTLSSQTINFYRIRINISLAGRARPHWWGIPCVECGWASPPLSCRES